MVSHIYLFTNEMQPLTNLLNCLTKQPYLDMHDYTTLTNLANNLNICTVTPTTTPIIMRLVRESSSAVALGIHVAIPFYPLRRIRVERLYTKHDLSGGNGYVIQSWQHRMYLSDAGWKKIHFSHGASISSMQLTGRTARIG